MTRMARLRRIGRCGAIIFVLLAPGASRSDESTWAECSGPDARRRMAACSRLIETPGLDPIERSLAYALRALGYSLEGRHDLSLPDYDAAIRINPDFPTALNNRAWALFKSGRPQQGLGDVNRALDMVPLSPHALDTRAHIRQALGENALALEDYELAMRTGGERMVKLYQCGLQAAGLFEGAVDGLVSIALRRALATCVEKPECDPLPADEECRNATS